MSKTSDELAKIRQLRYTAAAVITVAGPALAAALAEGGASKWIAVAVAVGGLLTGTAGSAYAAHNTRAQRADGTFDAPASPVDQVLGGLSAITGAQATAAEVAAQAADDLAKVTTAITGAIGGVPVIGPALGVQAGDLVQQVIDAARPR